MKTITTIQDQTIWDIALQYFGSLESVFHIIESNRHIDNLATPLKPGMQIVLPDVVLDKQVVDYYSARGITLVSEGYPDSDAHTTLNDFNNDFNTSFD